MGMQKCKCGACIGLYVFDDALICPKCMGKEIDGLREKVELYDKERDIYAATWKAKAEKLEAKVTYMTLEKYGLLKCQAGKEE